MNEQNQSSNWYVNRFSSIFEFHSQSEIDCSIHKQQDNHEAEEFDFYSYIEEIFHFRYISMLRPCLDHSIKEAQSWYVCIVL